MAPPKQGGATGVPCDGSGHSHESKEPDFKPRHSAPEYEEIRGRDDANSLGGELHPDVLEFIEVRKALGVSLVNVLGAILA